jgi:hypothetical protein
VLGCQVLRTIYDDVRCDHRICVFAGATRPT